MLAGAGRSMIAATSHRRRHHGAEFGSAAVVQQTCDRIPTFWVKREQVHGFLRHLKHDVDRPYKMLYDLTAIDERMRTHRDGQPPSDFTVVYHLLSFDRNEYVRIKVPLDDNTTVLAQHYRPLARGQLVRARSVGHVRDHL